MAVVSYLLLLILLPAQFSVAEHPYTFHNVPVQSEDEINLFLCQRTRFEQFAFVSISEKFRMSLHPDSAAIPNVAEWGIDSARYFRLGLPYRKRVLTNSGIDESDSIFLYDYAHDQLVVDQVKNLQVVAYVNAYARKDDWPYQQTDYMFGFEINSNRLEGFSDSYQTTLVVISKADPFIRGQLRRLEWEMIGFEEFPVSAISGAYLTRFKEVEYETGQHYQCRSEDLTFYVQDLMLKKSNYLWAKRLIVIDNSSNEEVFESVYFAGESVSLTGTGQWTGMLFKDHPPVIFGFQEHAFGCASISLMDSSNKSIYINCDNWH